MRLLRKHSLTPSPESDAVDAAVEGARVQEAACNAESLVPERTAVPLGNQILDVGVHPWDPNPGPGSPWKALVTGLHSCKVCTA